MKSIINIVIAHDLEAKHPVKWLDLQQVGDTPKHYSNAYFSDRRVNLVVGGEGQACSSDAVEYLASKTSKSIPAAWLNFGIAGHQESAIGTAIVPDKIQQESSGELQYPAPMLEVENRGLLITVDKPELEYPEDAAYDMEGYSFWQSAIKHSSLELVHCLKIVSDNREQPVKELNMQKIDGLLRNSKADFLKVVDQLHSLLNQCPQQFPFPDLYDELTNSIRFSVTQQSQLKRLLQRYHALNLTEDLKRIAAGHDSARTCIGVLENGLQGKL